MISHKIKSDHNLLEKLHKNFTLQDGLVFWTDIGDHAKIERAYLDGSDRKVIVKDNLKSPQGLSLDLKQRKIYWCDSEISGLFSVDYEGQNREVLLKGQTAKWLSRPVDLAYFEGRLYWLDETFNSGSVSSVSTIINDNPEILAQKLGHDVHDIKIMSKKNQQGIYLLIIIQKDFVYVS